MMHAITLLLDEKKKKKKPQFKMEKQFRVCIYEEAWCSFKNKNEDAWCG